MTEEIRALQAQIDALREENEQIKEVLAVLAEYSAVTVDLRIGGVVRPVVLFAKDPNPGPRFEVVT